jgi:diguanylate cyclase (GGDEF)-like protein/PAS domain S-box-containing protein
MIQMPLVLNAYAEFLETIPDAALVVDRAGTIMLVNSQTETMFGYGVGKLKNQSLQCLLPETKRAIHARHVEGYFDIPKMRSMGSGIDLSGRRSDGNEFPVDVMLKPIEVGGTLHALCIVRDITERKRDEAALKKAVEREKELARTDYLTGAANARFFHELVQQEIGRFGRYRRPFTIAYVDLDNFKTVNDLFGHSIGDKVLCTVVQHANSQLRKTDFVARLGGDEFAFLLTETDSAAALTTISKIHQGLLSEMQRNDWPVTFSIGVLTCIDTPRTADELVKMADGLMYSVKNSGKNAIHYAVYS